MIDHRTVDPKDLIAAVKAKIEMEHLSTGAVERGTEISRPVLIGYLKHGKLPVQLGTKKKLADFVNGPDDPPPDSIEGRLAMSPDQRLQRTEVVYWRERYYVALDIIKELLR